MKAFKWVWQYISKYKYRMFGALFLVLVCSGLNMINPYLSGKVVDEIILGKNTKLLIPMILIMTGTVALRSVVRYTFQRNFEFVSQGVIYDIRDEIYMKLQGLDFGFFDRTRTGDIMARMTGDMEAVRHFTAGVIYSIFENTVIFIFAVVMMMSINVKFTLIMLCITPFTAFFAYKLSRKVKPAFFAIREQFSKLNTVVQENISGNRVVKAFTQEDYEIKKFSEKNDDFKQKNLDASGIWARYLPVLDSLGGAYTVVMILVGGIMVINGTLTYGQLVTFNSLLFAINNPMRMMGWLLNDAQRFAASGEKIMTLVGTESEIKNPPAPVKKDRIEGAVEFKNVSFSYKDEPVLQDISFKAKPGQTVAIIGPTGSGKSTLISLICRFYDADSGEVLIDGVNIKNIELGRLRKDIGSAMQDIFLYSDTIEGNIAYGVPDAPMDDVVQAAEVASAHEFIKGFPEGYDTIIGERGVGLSGGQRQRIALARALIKDPSIMILDDTTSSVDMETEYEIQKALKTFYRNKTTFIIAHRISSVKNADMILVLEDGRIVERGKHNELLAKKGYYYSVYMNQYGNFESKLAEDSAADADIRGVV